MHYFTFQQTAVSVVKWCLPYSRRSK